MTKKSGAEKQRAWRRATRLDTSGVVNDGDNKPFVDPDSPAITGKPGKPNRPGRVRGGLRIPNPPIGGTDDDSE
jgi:hypothetical protein